jgi:acyl transferase domain-containing protein
LHFRVPNPKIAFEDLRLRVVDKHVPLPDGHDPVVMGASSYGFGGTNAHVIVQEYRPSGTTPDEQATRHRSLEEANLLLISARSKSALQALAASYATLLPKISRTVLPDLCSTAALQRTHHQDRLVAAASDPAELARRLERFSRGEQTARLATAHVTAERPKLAFVYSGNGSQWSGMGRTLIENDGAFRRDVEIVDDLFLAHSGWSIMTELRQTEDAARMELTEVAQPTLFALQVGMTNLLRRAGVSPAAVVGHSVGEVAAAWASGALSLEQAVHTIYVRSRAQGRTAGAGAMAAVGLSAEAAAAVLAEIGGWIEIAGINSPRSITVAGDPAALDSLEQLLRPDGAFFRKLPLNYAFHSAAMDAVEAEVRDELQWTTATATIPFISTVEGSPIPGTQLNGAYWWRNIREPVRFSDAVTFLIKDGSVNIFVEVGPHPILRDYIQQCAVDGRVAATVVPTLRRPRESSLDTELDQIWTAICACHASGASELTTLFQRPRHPVPLPPYPWQRQRHWVGAAPMPGIRIPVTRDHPLLGHRVESGDAIWENTLSLMVTPWLQDHVIGNSTLFPFAAFIEMILAAGSRLFGNQPLDIEDLDLRKALVVPDDSSPIIQLTIGEDGDVRLRSLRTPGAEDWISHCGGGVSVAPVGDRARNIVIDAIASRLGTVIPGPEHYRQVAARGFAFGPRFQGVAEIRVGRNEALAKVSIPHGIADEVDVYRLHPCLLDACLQALSPLIAAEDQNSGFVFLPAQIQRFRLYRGGARPMWSHATVRSRSRRSILADIAIVDEAGGKIAELT